MTENNASTPDFAALLKSAVEEPGMIMKAYSAFHGYSLGNQLIALTECFGRGIEPGPINTFPGWKDLGRHVRKGEKAITLCMPVTCKGSERDRDSGEEREVSFTRFIYRPRWFVLAQTEGADVEPESIPGWDAEKALTALDIERIAFTETDGNCQGYARKRQVAINPVAQLPHKTLFHEAGHVLLGHTSEADFNDSERTPKSLREVEAECVALLCCEALGLEGADYARGYVQHWIRGESIPEPSARKIMKVADQIIKAGQLAS